MKTPPPPPKSVGAKRQFAAAISSILIVSTLAFVLLAFIEPSVAHDLLRRQQPAAHNQNQDVQNSLANIQLPPQLASLTPQRLHQLAQLRELQLQQEAAARQQEASAPAPIGLELQSSSNSQQPTAQPASTQNSGQIPQPTTATQAAAAAAASSVTNGAERNQEDSGAYNESGSELEGVAMSGASDATGGVSGSSAAAAGAAAAPTFEVNWNKCPQLEPGESEKTKKTQVITKCLQAAPIPSNLTRENVEAHREQIATCALRVEGWFDDSGAYKYEKAEAEIRGKKLESSIETQVLKFHVACKEEANKKFPRDQNKLIDQVQFYQACMDYYISIVCEIEVSVDQ